MFNVILKIEIINVWLIVWFNVLKDVVMFMFLVGIRCCDVMVVVVIVILKFMLLIVVIRKNYGKVVLIGNYVK